MRFFFNRAETDLEYKIEDVIVEETRHGFKKITLVLSDVHGVYASRSVSMTMSELDLPRIILKLEKAHEKPL